MHADVYSATQAEEVLAARARITLLFALIVIVILAIVWPVTRAMIETWQNSSTYSHCYLVLPIAVWMVWRESAAPARLPPEPFWLGLIAVIAICVIGLLAQAANVAVVAQFAAVGAVVATVLTVLGWRWVRRLAFPLAFLFFAVPFGEAWLPVLMQWTADVTVAALRLTGIPVYREGNFFVIPSGSWSIVEACGGVRFILAALMTSCLFAWLQYRAGLKRIVFVALAVTGALLANWLRAYAIVLMAHFSNNRIGSGADHQWWGWLIFAALMFALFVIGARWSDEETHHRSTADSSGAHRRVTFSMVTPLAACALLVAAWPAAAAWIESRADRRPIRLEAIVPNAGWQTDVTSVGDWVPKLVAPAALDVQTFVRDGHMVSVYRGVYRGQRPGSELVNAMNQVVGSEDARWRLVDSGSMELRINGEPVRIKTSVVRGESTQYLIWHWYWLGGEATSSDVWIKLELGIRRLTRADDTAAWVAVYTPVGDDIAAGTRVLASFVDTMSGAINAALETTASR